MCDRNFFKNSHKNLSDFGDFTHFILLISIGTFIRLGVESEDSRQSLTRERQRQEEYEPVNFRRIFIDVIIYQLFKTLSGRKFY